MSYRNIKPVLLEINDLAGHCGLFTSDTELNNGYGCRSKSKIKDETGKCYSWSCPLAYSAYLEDLKKLDKYLYNEYKGTHNEDACGQWIVQYREVV